METGDIGLECVFKTPNANREDQEVTEKIFSPGSEKEVTRAIVSEFSKQFSD